MSVATMIEAAEARGDWVGHMLVLLDGDVKSSVQFNGIEFVAYTRDQVRGCWATSPQKAEAVTRSLDGYLDKLNGR